MMDENNLIHSTDLYLGYALGKEKYAMSLEQEDYEAKKQKAIALLSLKALWEGYAGVCGGSSYFLAVLHPTSSLDYLVGSILVPCLLL